MRMKMIGYGKFRYAIKSGKRTEWPVIGVALQKNYMSVYVSVTRQGAPIVPSYAGRLGELRVGANNFSFERFDQLKQNAVPSLVAEIERIFTSDPREPNSIHARMMTSWPARSAVWPIADLSGAARPGPLVTRAGLRHTTAAKCVQVRPFQMERKAAIVAPRILSTIAEVAANQFSIKSFGFTIRKSRSTIKRLAP